MRYINAVLCRLHVPERRLDGGWAVRLGHVVPDREPVRVLRLFDHRLSNRAVGDDRRGVSQTDPGHAWRRGHVRRTLHHIHRAPDIPVPPGAGQQIRYVRSVRCRVFTQHHILLLLLPGDQKQNATGDRGVVPQ